MQIRSDFFTCFYCQNSITLPRTVIFCLLHPNIQENNTQLTSGTWLKGERQGNQVPTGHVLLQRLCLTNLPTSSWQWGSQNNLYNVIWPLNYFAQVKGSENNFCHVIWFTRLLLPDKGLTHNSFCNVIWLTRLLLPVNRAHKTAH